MTELDPQLQALLARSRTQVSPPAGVEDQMLANFRARLEGPPGGEPPTDEPPAEAPDPGIDPSSPAHTSGLGPKAQLVHGLKIAGAVLGLSTIGIGGLWVIGQGARADRGPALVEAATANPTPGEPPRVQPEPRQTPLAPDSSAEPLAGATDEAPVGGPQASSRAKAKRPSASGGATLAAELRLIQAARAAPPAQALELLDRHAAEFPAGELELERVALRAVALCDLGRLDEAQAARATLAQAELGPLLRTKVEAACAAKKN